METQIGTLVQMTQTYSPVTTGQVIYDYFNNNPDAEAVVILDGNAPCGIISRNDFYQKIGSLYGHSLYMNRSIDRLMNADALIVDSTLDTSEVAVLAMGRSLSSMYEPIVVVDNGQYAGIVSIKLFMYQFSKQRENELNLLTVQQKILQESHESEVRHRHEIEEKNLALESRNSAVKNLLDNAGQGFLSFGSDLMIGQEYSKECDRIFGFPVSGISYLNLIINYMDTSMENDVRTVLERIFLVSEPIKARVYLSMLPEEHIVGKRTIRFSYRTIREANAFKVMAILTDITEKKQLEEKMELERNNVKLILQALENQSDLKILMDDLRELIKTQLPQSVVHPGTLREALSEAYKTIHSFKGEFSQYYMYHTASALHEVEDHIGFWLNTHTPCDIYKINNYFGRLDADQIMGPDAEIIKQTLGDRFFGKQQTVSVQKELLLDLESDMIRLLPASTANQFLPKIKKMLSSSMKQLFMQYESLVQTLSEKLDKMMSPLEVTGNDVYIVKSDYQALFRAFIHLFRNMVDHGIEKPDERMHSGKPAQGKISITLETHAPAALKIIFRDDGRGVDIDSVRQKALEKGLITHTPVDREELLDLLFSQGFSLKSEVSMISGRGTGLSALKKEVERLNGTIHIESALGSGTAFIIDLPVNHTMIVEPA